MTDVQFPQDSRPAPCPATGRYHFVDRAPSALDNRELRDRGILIHDRLDAGEMASDPDCQTLLDTRSDAIAGVDRADVDAKNPPPSVW
ncbi:MAG: hypothetical protein KDA89_13865 [Planctomycetaceae bacterium]|nr:hypothetical protein [Planctomycetaceae bacterium]